MGWLWMILNLFCHRKLSHTEFYKRFSETCLIEFYYFIPNLKCACCLSLDLLHYFSDDKIRDGQGVLL